MLGVGANDKDTPFAADNLAILAHFFHRRAYFHGVITNIRIAANIRICIFVFDSYIRDDSLLQPVDDPPLGSIIGRELDPNPVSGQHPNVVEPHPAGQMRKDFLPII